VRPDPDARRRALAAPAGVLVALLRASPAQAARGVALGAPGGGAREHDSASTVGNRTTGDPALDYVLHCQGCHRADGSATAGAVPALAGSMARFLAVDGGREYLARVPGAAQSLLDDAALAALLNWMLARFDPEHLPRSFEPYRAEEVGELRKEPLIEPQRARARLLARALR
jgi:mono/diheme cytochrome c family protein